MGGANRIGLRSLRCLLLVSAALAPLPAFAQSEPGAAPSAAR